MSHRQYSVQGNQIEKLNARLLSISFSKDEMDWKSVFHSHPFTELFYVVSGEGNFLFRGETYHIKTGDLIIVPPYMEHTEQSSSDLQYYVIGVEGISFQKKGEPACVQIYCNFQSKTVVANLLSLMFFEMSNPSYGSDKICQDLLEILLLWIIRDQHVIPVAFSATYMTKECAQIKDYLDSNYADHITLDTLTELTHMNKYYMAHSFSKHTGQSPIQYLNNRRMEAACTLLKDTDYSISSISSTVGFSSQSYFTQAFRKKYGMTPIRYRQVHAAENESDLSSEDAH